MIKYTTTIEDPTTVSVAVVGVAVVGVGVVVSESES